MQLAKINTDELFTVLAHSERRSILRFLQQNGEASIDALSNQLAGENEAVAADACSRIRSVELHHTHLPLLDASGFLDYDSATGRIEPSDLSDERLTTLLGIGAEFR